MKSTPEPSPVGKWNPELFARYRAAKPGPVRRAMLNELLRINAPLVKTLVDQLCGRGEVKRKAVKLGGCQGFRDIPWDDAYQAGCIAFMKAMDRFNPEKGKLPFYLLMKIRYELQVIVGNELRLTRVPRGREEEAISVTLVGEQRDLDELGGCEHAGIASVEGITPDDIAEWERTGEWPEDLQALRRQVETARWARTLLEQRQVDCRPAHERFVAEHLRLWRHGRMAAEPLYSMFERFAEGLRLPSSLSALRATLEASGVRRLKVRAPWSGRPVAGFAGVALNRPDTSNAARTAENLARSAA